MPLPDEAIDALVAGVPVDPADVMALAGALSLGEPEAEVERLELETRERVWTDDTRAAVAQQLAARRSDPLASAEALEAAATELAEGDRFPRRLARVAALRLLLTDPAMREHFASLEAYLQRAEDDEEIERLSIPLAGEAALAAASIDLERALHEAGLYIDSFPKPGLAVEGDLAERASLWLAERLKLTEDEEAARPRMRRAVAAFAEAARQEFPLSAQGLRAVAGRDDELWQALADRIVARRIVNIGW